MEQASNNQQSSWFSRQSFFYKCLLVIIPTMITLGLVLGLAVGLTVGRPQCTHSSSASVTPSSSTPIAADTVWQPAVNASWQIVLQNAIALSADAKSVTPDVSIYDIDLFTNDASVMTALHRLGKKVICYFSAGSYEPGRPDSGDFHASDKGKELDGWPGEFWLNLSSTNVRSIMTKRIALARAKGCDAIDPDNVDGYQNENGLGLTDQDSINYINFLANEAKSQGLATGLKNAGDIIPKVLPVVQFSVNEQCAQYSECSTFKPFIDHQKPVFHIEYPSDSPKISEANRAKYCSTTGVGAGSASFSNVLKNMNLDGFVEYCNGATASTPLNTTGSN